MSLALLMTVDGVSVSPGDVAEPLLRAVIVSLFTWRRADPADDLPGPDRMGWWGDTFPSDPNDRIGSRLWLLGRSKLTADVPGRAAEYAREALAWLTADGVAASVSVEAERQGLDRLALGIRIVRGDAAALNIRFADVWEYLTRV